MERERLQEELLKEGTAEKLLDNICLWRLELKMLEILLSLGTNKYLWKPEGKR